MNYWDTSALMKLYVAEADSDDFLALAASETMMPVTSELSRVEMLAALHRKELTGALSPSQASVLHAQFVADLESAKFMTLSASTACFREAERVISAAYASQPPVPVRCLDALHVATALTEGSPSLVSADVRQRNVALLMGLITLP